MLLNAVIFNFLAGNHDAHGKNFSLLHQNHDRSKGILGSNRSVLLAPLYDIVCTSLYPGLSKKMAMKIGSEYDSGKISLEHFEKLAKEAGLASPLVRRRVQELAQLIMDELEKIDPSDPAAIRVATLIKAQCGKVISWFRK